MNQSPPSRRRLGPSGRGDSPPVSPAVCMCTGSTGGQRQLDDIYVTCSRFSLFFFFFGPPAGKCQAAVAAKAAAAAAAVFALLMFPPRITNLMAQ